VTQFNSDDEVKAWADAWVAARIPSALVLDLTQLEHEHFAQFNSDYGRFVDQFEVEFTALAMLIDDLNFIDRSTWPPHRYVQYVLLAKNVKTFYSALERLARGYYEDSITLVRGLYETFVRLLFISCHPDDAYSALGYKAPKGMRQFKLTNFLRDELRLEWDTNYSVMSVFAHSNSFNALEALIRADHRDGDPERFRLEHQFDLKLAEMTMPLLQFVLCTHLRFATERMVGAGHSTEPDALATALESVDLLSYGLKHHPKPYWRSVSDDLDLLFEMIEIADKRDDWRAFLRSRAT